MFVGAKGGNVGDKVVNYQSHTAASASSASAKHAIGKSGEDDTGSGAGSRAMTPEVADDKSHVSGTSRKHDEKK